MRLLEQPFGFDGSRGGTGVLAPPPGSVRRRQAPAPPRSPPEEPPDPGGGGGRGPGGDGDERSPESTGRFALLLALAGIGTLFLVLLAVWLLLRRRGSDWPPDGIWSPPQALWISTLLLAASSVAIERAARLARWADPGERNGVLRALGGTFALGILFLGAQVFLWRALWLDGLLPSSSGYGAVFYALTGLHGLHVAGGLAFLASLTLDLASAGGFVRRRYGVRLCATYWHFMGVIWLVLFALLYFDFGG